MIEKAKSKQISEEIGAQGDEDTAWFDRETGEVVLVTDEEMKAAEEGRPLDDYPEWQHTILAMAKNVVDDVEGRYLLLPSKWDFHEAGWAVSSSWILLVIPGKTFGDISFFKWFCCDRLLKKTTK